MPARRDAETFDVRQGGVLFERIRWGDCHRAHFRTGDALEPELSLQEIWPYTDLLLHDMGDGLADGRVDGDATGRAWRTPPLWGVGLLPVVNGQYDLLHDGRARSLNWIAETAIQLRCFLLRALRRALPRLAKPDRVPHPAPLRV